VIELPLTADAESYGKRVKSRYDREGARDTWRKDGPDKRWAGHAVEYELSQWLATTGIPYQWNYDGLHQTKADFELNGIGVAVKANQGDAPRDDFTFVVSEHHVKRLNDGVLFCITQLRDRKIWVAGYIDAHKFRSIAERHRKGEEGFVKGRPFSYDCRTIGADALTPAEQFINLVKRSVA
jgi:hypothetical protein